MSAAVTPRIFLAKTFTFVNSRAELKQPGDYCILTFDFQKCVLLVCVVCGKNALADQHKIVSEVPLTLEPRVVCPCGASYKIEKGAVA